jgi:uncharacterized protein YndB with AHSA1/START domain
MITRFAINAILSRASLHKPKQESVTIMNPKPVTANPQTVHARAGEQSLTFIREFNAPASLLIRAHTEVDLFVRWMGPKGTTCHVAHFDARTGGSFNYAVDTWAFFGSYNEVTDIRIVHTWQYAGDPRPTLETLTFVDLPDGRCRLEGLSAHRSAAHSTEMLASDESGAGMDENFARIDDLLESGF